MTCDDSIRVAIVGGGLAAASLAFHLGPTFGDRVTLIEREAGPGMHSSGRSAEMIRQAVLPPPVARLARRSAEVLGRAKWARFRPTGSLLLGSEASLTELRDALGESDALPPGADITRAAAHLPPGDLRAALGERAALWTPTDGIVDASSILSHFLDDAARHGVTIRYGTPVEGVVVEDGQVKGVRVDGAFLAADIVVNATGAWVGAFAEGLGALPVGWSVLRRHLAHLGPAADIPRDLPFIWDIDAGWYLRPESRGLLACACDESPSPPCDPQVDRSVLDALGRKLSEAHLPLDRLPVRRCWAGLRTFAPDRTFVIGFDPCLDGFFWMGGLGGHGVTCSWAAGELGARLLAGESPREAESFDPARFLDHSAGEAGAIT